MRKDTTEIIQRITNAAKYYKENVVGKTFLFLFEGNSVEVMFKSNNFMHLCGVDTRLYAKEFLRKAARGQLHRQEISFSPIHPYSLADIKTSHLMDTLHLMNLESLMITDISTKSRSYRLGTTDLKIVLCFDSQLDNEGNAIGNVLVPYSLRVEEIDNSRFDKIYEVDYVLSKKTGVREYNHIEYGELQNLKHYLSEYNISECIINTDFIVKENDV
jgi:hypothetical protein